MPTSIRDAYNAKGYQGASPEMAKYIFWGTDANFDARLAMNEFEKQRNCVLEYLEDPFSFWKSKNKHHPFLTKEFELSPFAACNQSIQAGTKMWSGKSYHEKFAKLRFSFNDWQEVSFVDLCGYSENVKFKYDAKTCPGHFEKLINSCLVPTKINVMTPTVLDAIGRIFVKFPDLANKYIYWKKALADLDNGQTCVIPAYIDDDSAHGKGTAVLNCFHFSSAVRNEYIDDMSRVLRSIASCDFKAVPKRGNVYLMLCGECNRVSGQRYAVLKEK